ncbi:hypothetical protein FACS1894180_1270 [Bacteroidia bacterium]|nr:hypothetical protein FACS1894180_1270 [Bacteroidia bacterium]
MLFPTAKIQIFESRQIEVEIDGKKKIKTTGSRVIPRSSPLFQEFKIWQILNNIEVSVNGRKIKRNKKNIGMENLFAETEDALELEGKRALYQEEKELLAKELFVKEKLTKAETLKLLFENPQELDLNFKTIDGNRTGAALFQTYSKIIEFSGHEPIDFKKSAIDIIEYVKEIFTAFDWNTDILQFDSDAELDKQPYYKLWHLLYSFEGDNTPTGNGNLIQKITDCYGFEKEYATILANVTFQDDYGSLSAKAIRKILPHLKEGNGYDVACVYAGYEKHSKSSLTKEEIENKILKDKLEILPKNSLRNPVVEKILNQMVNVINTIIDTYGKPDEIRVELARELKKNAKEREELTKSVAENTKAHEEIKKKLQSEFGLSHVSRTDIVRYKLWQELKANGYKTLYSNTYISPAKLFTGEFDIEHIIPQARLFDDSFSNKTLEKRDVNIAKGNRTAYDFVKEEYGEDGLQNYLNRVEMLYNTKSRENADEDVKSAGTISKSKYNKLKMEEKDIPEGFIERDLRNTQYIAKKALEMLNEIVRFVVPTTGGLTDRLREDWQLVDLMKELNWDKYNKLGLTEIVEDTDYNGNIYRFSRIKPDVWTKRNDHRHHAMDALTVAFTKRSIIQYLNNLSARIPKKCYCGYEKYRFDTEEYKDWTCPDCGRQYFAKKDTNAVYGIERNDLYRNSKGKLLIKPPFELNEFRAEAKRHLENTLISIKAKNKVVTTNINTTKKKGGTNKKAQQTPRGQLHMETVYGRVKRYVTKEENIGATFDVEKIASVTKPIYREALLARLATFDNNPKKAFTGSNALDKKPIWLNESHTEQVPKRIKTVTLETIYTIRKPISADITIEDVIDKGIQEILKKRLTEYGGKAKEAFSNIGENPIFNKNGKEIKSVTVAAVSNVVSLHDKKDKDGKPILDENGKKQSVDFVQTRNNHHAEIFKVPVLDRDGNLKTDEQGNAVYELKGNIVSFFESLARVNAGVPIIDKGYKDKDGIKVDGSEFLFSIKQNEYFVLPQYAKKELVNEETGEITGEEEVVIFNPEDIDLLNSDNYSLISPNLYRIQKMKQTDSGGTIFFRHHLETDVQERKELKDIAYTSKVIANLKDIVKVRVNHIGQIVSVGEY